MTAPPQSILPVIVCGGAGTRLWPVSTPDVPKPFHAMLADESLFQQTVRRVTGGGGEGFLAPVIVCGLAHRALVEAQMAAIGVVPGAIVLEPCGRGTAPIAAIAAEIAEREHPGSLVLLLAADHLIPDAASYRRTVLTGVPVAHQRIVVLGVTPTRAETGYGYVKRGARLAEGLYAVNRFVEKPDAATAEAYVASGDYSWNGCAFLYAPALMREEMQAARPDIAKAALSALPADLGQAVIELDAARYGLCPAEAIDRAVMEKTTRAAVVLCDFSWADVGAWDEVWRLGGVDADKNNLRGDVRAVDVSGSLVWSDGPTIAAIGVSDLVIVATKAGVLVAPRARAQEIRALAESLATRSSDDG